MDVPWCRWENESLRFEHILFHGCVSGAGENTGDAQEPESAAHSIDGNFETVL